MLAVSARNVAAWAGHLGLAPSDLDPEALRHSLTRGTIPGVLATAATRHPSAVLSIEDQSLSHAELYALAARHAAVLANRGVSRGSRVVISAGSSLRLVVSYLATLHLGAVAVLVNPAYSTAELHAVIDRSAPALIILDDDPKQTGPDLEQSHPDPSDPGRAAGVPVLGMGDLADEALRADAHPPPDLGSEDLALLAFTSGTTGSPKAVPLTHGQLLASIRSAMWAWRWDRTDTLVHALPLFHQHGLSGVHASLLAGSNATILSTFDPAELLTIIVREGATVLFGIPSIHQRLVALDPAQLAALSGLRLITSGSAPLSAALAEKFHQKAGVQPLERYGLTETGLNVSNPYEGERVAGTVGYPLPGTEVALTSPEGEEVGTENEGEIVLRGPQVFDGYLEDPEATAAAFWPGGWFRTGDLGRWDAQGRLVITGRLKDLIITGGMNVAPQEVEEVVERFPAVREAAVAGLPSERWGEEVAVWVVAEDGVGVPAAEVIAHCRGNLAAYKCPKQVFYVDSLPRNAMGKISRSELAGLSRR
ncbi:MAG TPA: class I adenylate-forming enzyme family protein [Nocardioidaceae bacterium]|nr:class I adenylate-forming enzyme family protein [Nocardioidaceae bacterium]